MTCHLFRSKAKRRSSGRLSLDKSPMEQVANNNVENFQIGQRCEVPWCLFPRLRFTRLLGNHLPFLISGQIWDEHKHGVEPGRNMRY